MDAFFGCQQQGIQYSWWSLYILAYPSFAIWCLGMIIIYTSLAFICHLMFRYVVYDYISFVNNTLGDCCYLFTILLLPFGNTIHNTLSITSVVHPQFMFFLAVVFITMFPPSAVKIGRPGYTVTKQYDPDTKQHSFLFEVSIQLFIVFALPTKSSHDWLNNVKCSFF